MMERRTSGHLDSQNIKDTELCYLFIDLHTSKPIGDVGICVPTFNPAVIREGEYVI